MKVVCYILLCHHLLLPFVVSGSLNCSEYGAECNTTDECCDSEEGIECQLKRTGVRFRYTVQRCSRAEVSPTAPPVDQMQERRPPTAPPRSNSAPKSPKSGIENPIPSNIMAQPSAPSGDGPDDGPTDEDRVVKGGHPPEVKGGHAPKGGHPPKGGMRKR